MRITRGNRGGVFVHLRPAILTREAAEERAPEPLVTAPPPAPSVTSWYDRGIRLTPPPPLEP
jgi:hypothetical protein